MALPFMKPRIPISQSTSARRLDLSFLKQTTFWMLQIGNIIQSFGYFLPTTFLPSFSTTTVGLSQNTGTMLVSLFNATSIIGGIALGVLCDRFSVTNIMLLSSVGSALSVLLFWGMVSSSDSESSQTAIALLIIFSITYGFFAGGFSSTWSGVITQIKRDSSSPSLDTGLIFGLLAGGRGIGNVISGPLSTVLLQSGSLGDSSGGNTGYETQYGTLILFTGITAIFGAWSWMWRYISPALRCFR
ncbi:Major facilitator superfamily domain general substrate transporter [Penicillium cf. griseofulvum]|nr:Major facilitator superfamily domain general substrate transporter [Penicillium cf. griseofulvum]KAJ5428494.1 Major facilitator superfamily domain general substrate transporter [Penicillium cf. griseofulvum]